MLVQLACYCGCSSSWCCCWAGGDGEGVGAAPGVAAAAGMEEKMRALAALVRLLVLLPLLGWRRK
jgi:hypothetical protein